MKSTHRLAVALAAALLAWVTPANAGKVYISGQDSDDLGHVSVAFGTQLLEFIDTGNTNPGSGILILGGDLAGQSRTTINAWNVGAGATLTQAPDAASIAAANFSLFAGILIPSAVTQTGGGLSQAELNAINARAVDIANFVNGGGNLMAFTEAGLTGAFNWFPLGALSIVNEDYLPVSQTPALAAAGFTATNAELSGDLYHNVFTGPPGFFGLQVLAVNAEAGSPTNGQAAILGGGTTTQICGVPGAPPCPAPEPGSITLAALALAALTMMRRRRLPA